MTRRSFRPSLPHRLWRTLALCTALLVFTLSGAAGDPTSPEAGKEQTFFDSVNVRVVNVEVFVTDRDGRQVTGLTREDFEIYEDGKPVDVTYFYDSHTAPAPARATTAGLAGGIGAAEEVPEDQRLQLAIFFDNTHLTAPARNRLIPALRKFVSTRIQPREKVLLASYDGPGSLRIRQVPSGDLDALVAALDHVALASTAGVAKKSDARNIVQHIESSPWADIDSCPRAIEIAASDAQAAVAEIEDYAMRANDDTRSAVQALERFIDGLAGLSGRKAVLFVSGGMSVRPGQALYGAWSNKYGGINQKERLTRPMDSVDSDASAMVDRVGARANANRISFYALGAPDLLESRSAAAMHGNEVYTQREVTVEANNMGQSLFMMSAPTGGLADIQAIDPGSLLDLMRKDFDGYYSLGYTPVHGRTGKEHRIAIKMKRPGLKVRHRETYRDRNSQEVLRDRTLAALLFGTAENPLEVKVELGPGEDNGKGEEVVPVIVKLPMSKLVLLPQGEFHEGRVTIQLAVRDAKGGQSGISEVQVPVRIPNEQLLTALGQNAGYRTKLSLRPASHTLAVSVRDDLGNAESTVITPYEPVQEATTLAADRTRKGAR